MSHSKKNLKLGKTTFSGTFFGSSDSSLEGQSDIQNTHVHYITLEEPSKISLEVHHNNPNGIIHLFVYDEANYLSNQVDLDNKTSYAQTYYFNTSGDNPATIDVNKKLLPGHYVICVVLASPNDSVDTDYSLQIVYNKIYKNASPCINGDKSSQKCCKKLRCCNSPIVITALPIVITKPGGYILCNNLEYGGPTIGIIIQASNVDIDFKGNSITVLSSIAAGRLCRFDGCKNVKVHNGTITIRNPSGPTVRAFDTLNNPRDLVLDGIIIRDFFRAFNIIGNVDNLEIINCTFINLPVGGCLFTSFGVPDTLSNLRVIDCEFTNVRFVGVLQAISKNVIIERCQVNRTIFTVIDFVDACENILVKDCQFRDCDEFAMLFNGEFSNTNTCIVDTCQFSGTAIMESLIQMGSFSEANATNMIVRNCNFDMTRTVGTPDPLFPPTAILIFSGPGDPPGSIVARNVLIDNNTIILSKSCVSGIILGLKRVITDPPEIIFYEGNTVTIRNNTIDTINGFSLTGVSANVGNGALIENNMIRNTSYAGILVKENFKFANIQNNTIITGGGDGIAVENTTGVNVNNNSISDHCGAGIRFDSASVNNIAQNNTTFLNGNGINSTGNNLVTGNIEYANLKVCLRAQAETKSIEAIQRRIEDRNRRRAEIEI